MSIRSAEILEAPAQWAEDDLDYFSVTLNGRRTIRLGLSTILKELEGRRLFEADGDGRYVATLDATEILRPRDMLRPVPPSLLGETELGRKLAKHRGSFGLLERQQHRGYAGTAV